ncbi:phosphate transport system permease protein [Caldalkalibacillus uzonensis]|uniref:Phosphate transport system permease protein n=2 Tax=Caldalkalibacillus uzonensis TaxID=353224 RepID=A0ABU0CVF0_9BACI|nr:phosphate transport system permease protein [Caldalkalibacillus uzonensis]
MSVRSELKAMTRSPEKKILSHSVREQIKFNRSRSFKMSRAAEWLIPKLFLACAFLSILVTFGIIYTLLKETIGFFGQVSIVEFVTGTQWTPLFQPQQFGVLPLVAGSVLVAAIASMVAIPIGLASAVFLSEYAPDRVRRVVKPILEVLAGVPTIVYGFFALSFVTPLLRVFIPDLGLFNALSAGIVVGIMIIPMIASLSEDAMTAVPRSIREGAYALGATRLEVALKVVVPAAFSGIVASFVLAISRAIGETMIVTIAAGAMPNFTFNPVEPVQTLTAYIVQVSLGDTPFGSIEYYTIYAVGMTLFVLTFVMNMIAGWVSRRFKEDY